MYSMIIAGKTNFSKITEDVLTKNQHDSHLFEIKSVKPCSKNSTKIPCGFIFTDCRKTQITRRQIFAGLPKNHEIREN